MFKKFLYITSLFLLISTSFIIKAEPSVTVENIWVREAPPTVNVLAGYMTLKNPTDQDITLICASSQTFEEVMFHQTEVVDNVARMRHADEIVIPAGGKFEFTPGGYHLMLMGKKQPLKAGDELALTLIFKNVENKKITATVKKAIAE